MHPMPIPAHAAPMMPYTRGPIAIPVAQPIAVVPGAQPPPPTLLGNYLLRRNTT
jgi:hypothetical protein